MTRRRGRRRSGRFVFDAPESGQGRRADWRAAAMLARRSELILGGGLDAGNVAAAIATVRPFGVDVSSGVECAPGVKDPMRIQAFVAAARERRRMSALPITGDLERCAPRRSRASCRMRAAASGHSAAATCPRRWCRRSSG